MALGLTDISTPLVRNTLGESTDDVGTLCKSSLINKWSKYKPVSSTSLGLASDDQFTIMKNANFGLTAVEIAGIVASAFRGATQSTLAAVTPAEWSYTKPSGGASSPYRLGDFRQYRHDSKPFLTGLSLAPWYSKVESLGILAMTFKWGDAVYQGMGLDQAYVSINLTELNIQNLDFATEEWRVGLACAVGNYYYIASSLLPIKDINSGNVGSAQVDLSLDTDFVAYLETLKSTEETTLNLIPFLGYRLQYVVEGSPSTNKYFKFLSGGKAFCLPTGDASIPFKVYGGVKGLGMTVEFTSIRSLMYFSGSTYDATINQTGSDISTASAVYKPSLHSGYTGIRVIIRFTFKNETNVSKTYTTSLFRLYFGAIAYTNTYFYDVNDNYGTHKTTITVAAGETRTLEISTYEGVGDTNKPIITALDNLPNFVGTQGSLSSPQPALYYNGTNKIIQISPLVKMV